MIEDQDEEVALLEESKRVPNYLTTSFHHFSHIFGVINTTAFEYVFCKSLAIFDIESN